MATIVDRHTNGTLFDSLSNNYRSQSVFYCFVINSSNELVQVLVEPARIISDLIWDKEYKKCYLCWYVANGSYVKTPKRVLKDARISEDVFISLCGHLCNNSDYEKTEELYEVTDISNDILSQQPKSGHSMPEENIPVKNNILHWNDIPSSGVFLTCGHYEWNHGYRYNRHSKYHREEVASKDVKEENLRGRYCPLVDEGYYENINVYEEDCVFYNPGSKFVQLNHAVTQENFFDKDGYLCSAFNYRYVNKEEIDKYYKLFLFLI